MDHTASSSRDASNNITTTVDAEYEHYNNTKAAAWGGWAYAQFSFTIPAGHSIESATLTWATTIGGNKGTRNNDIYYVNAGTTIDYAGLTSTTNVNPNGTWIVNVTKSGPETHTGIVTDVTSAVRTIAASQGYIIFKWTNNAAGANLHGKASANAPTLVITTTSETFYDATFNANDGAINPSVTVYTDAERTSPIAKDALRKNTTYYFTATLAGYNDYLGSFNVETSNPTVNFTMTAKPRFSFVVNAVDAEENVLEELYRDDDSYVGKSHNVVYPKYLTGAGNIVTFSKDNDTYGQNYTGKGETETVKIGYTAYNGVAYFFEGESILTNPVESWNYSNGRAARGLNGTKDVMTIPATGTYTINYAVCNNNVAYDVTYNFYRNSSEDVIKNETFRTISLNQVKTDGTKSVSNVSFTKDDVLQFNSNSTNTILDYVLVVLNSVPVTVPNAKQYATFNSDYALDFTGIEDVLAYTADVDGTTVTFTKVTGAVPAHTGLLIRNTAKDGASVNVPVVASAVAPTTNDFVAVTAEDGVDVTEGYILATVNGVQDFYPVNPSTGNHVAKGKAYLNASGAAHLSMVFEGEETTGIKTINNEQSTMSNVFDLQGRRVAAPQKGLYIVNGKKVVIK